MTPTERSLAELRKRGALAAVVEKWVPATGLGRPGFRRDLWGFADIEAHLPNGDLLYVQACVGSSVAARRSKILEDHDRAAKAQFLLSLPHRRIEVWGWRKVGPRGKRKLWELRVVPITLGDVAPGMAESA